MDVILLQKVQSLGDLGDLVTVKAGFGRNYLLPTGKAVPATKDNLAQFEASRTELEAAAKKLLGKAEARQIGLAEMVVQLSANASEEGNLYGSIGPREIAAAVSDQGHEISKSEVIMGEGPLRTVGEFDVVVHLHADVESIVRVIITPED